MSKDRSVRKRKPQKKVQEFPNEAELKLLAILNKAHPNGWEYVGNHALWIKNRNPDFIYKDGQKNGQKKVIELMGETYHAPSDEQDRIEHYKKYGYDCLVIWSKSMFRGGTGCQKKLVSRVRDFVRDSSLTQPKSSIDTGVH